MTAKTADANKLARLHEKLTDVLLELTEISEIKDEEGNVTKIGPSPAMLTVAKSFLKDNEITCNMQTDEKGSALADRLEGKKKRPLAAVIPLVAEAG